MTGSCTFLVLINSRSGGQDGPQVLDKFRQLASEGMKGEVVSLTDPCPSGNGVIGPRAALERFKNTSDLRVIACGGDGTVGWVLSEIDNVYGEDKPPTAIVPLGTGNDLSRSLSWGGRYKDKPIKKLLHDVEVATIEKLDRWKLGMTLSPDQQEKHPKALDEIPAQNRVFNNYFSIGIDAHIALQFHNARNANSDKFTSRTRNLLFYGLEGGKDLVVHKWRHLMDSVKLSCTMVDGSKVDFTEKLKNYGAHALLFLNIKSYSGGARPWKAKAMPPSPSDSLVEVIAMDNVDVALLQLGGTGMPVCQARKVEIEITRAVPMQVDGEPLMINPSVITVDFFNQARMLTKKKTSYPYRDPEVEEWAARKIQSSFKNYKREKSVRDSALS